MNWVADSGHIDKTVLEVVVPGLVLSRGVHWREAVVDAMLWHLVQDGQSWGAADFGIPFLLVVFVEGSSVVEAAVDCPERLFVTGESC